MKIANTFWERLQVRDRPETMRPTNPGTAKRKQPSRSTSAGTKDVVQETLEARDSDSRREAEAADAMRLTPHRKLMGQALAGSKVAAAKLARLELLRRGKISKEAPASTRGSGQAKTAEGNADTGDQAL